MIKMKKNKEPVYPTWVIVVVVVFLVMAIARGACGGNTFYPDPHGMPVIQLSK